MRGVARPRSHLGKNTHDATNAARAARLHGLNPERPVLRFAETAVAYCVISAATCPAEAITLPPGVDCAAQEDHPRRILDAQEPCRRALCGKLFGTRSGPERVQAKRAGLRAFAVAAARLQGLRMCDACRIEAALTKSSIRMPPASARCALPGISVTDTPERCEAGPDAASLKPRRVCRPSY
jgi:hypothetical protein